MTNKDVGELKIKIYLNELQVFFLIKFFLTWTKTRSNKNNFAND
jgi:hypothetical protein